MSVEYNEIEDNGSQDTFLSKLESSISASQNPNEKEIDDKLNLKVDDEIDKKKALLKVKPGKTKIIGLVLVSFACLLSYGFSGDNKNLNEVTENIDSKKEISVVSETENSETVPEVLVQNTSDDNVKLKLANETAVTTETTDNESVQNDEELDIGIIDILDSSENEELSKLMVGITETFNLPQTQIQDDNVVMGSVVSEQDITAINIKISNHNAQIDALSRLFREQLSETTKKIHILESEVIKKRYDLSFEKDRPIITNLVISRALSKCDSCVQHAAFTYKETNIQKANGQKWMSFLININGDRLTLTMGDIQYDYWSTFKAPSS